MAALSRPAGSPAAHVPRPTADALVAAVRVHLDRVHDAVRRLGCGPEQAVDVVETSAVELVQVLATRPEAVPDTVGWWFRRAHQLGRRVASQPDAPLARGPLSVGADQQRLADALEDLPERARVALLLRDAYDLPAASVGAALGRDADEAPGPSAHGPPGLSAHGAPALDADAAPTLDADAAMAVVARARLDLLPLLEGEPAPAVPAHAHDLASLGRLAEALPVAARDATGRRHVLSCRACSAVAEAQQRAHLRLAALTVVGLPDGARARVLSRVDEAARRLLPTAEASPVLAAPPVVEEGAHDDDEARLFSPLVVGLSLVLSALAGLGLGLLLTDRSQPEPVPGADGRLPDGIALVSPPPSPPPPPASGRTVAEVRPRTTVLVLPPPPSPSPPPPAPSPSPSALPVAPVALALSPRTGPNGTLLTASGSGFPPGARVQVDYLDGAGRPTPSRSLATADEAGTFTTELVAQDPGGAPGAHEVVATDGTRTARAVFTAEQ